jgi:hypothetical protein
LHFFKLLQDSLHCWVLHVILLVHHVACLLNEEFSTCCV